MGGGGGLAEGQESGGQENGPGSILKVWERPPRSAAGMDEVIKREGRCGGQSSEGD